MTDAEAIARSLRRPSAFERVFERHFAALFRYRRRRVGPQVRRTSRPRRSPAPSPRADEAAASDRRLDAAAASPSAPPRRRLETRRSVTLVVDPRAGMLLGTRTTLASGEGRVLADVRAVYESAVVHSTTARP